MLPIDERPLPDSITGELRRNIEMARALRAGPAKNAVEGLMALTHTGPSAMADYVSRRYINDQFGPEALDAYLAAIPNAAADFLPLAKREGARVSPLATAIKWGNEMTAGSAVLASRHARIVSDLIVNAMRGKGKRKIAVALPFRHGKSMLSSISLPVFWLLNNPHTQIGLCCHSTSLSLTFSRIVRNVLQGHAEETGVSLSSDSASIHTFSTFAGGGLWTGSVESGILGKGCDGVLILDDLLSSAEAAASRVERDRVWNFMMGTALTRLQDEAICVLVATRWSNDDPMGRLMSGYDGVDPSQWEFITLPAIATTDEALTGRKTGEALFPEKRPLEELESFRRSMSPTMWACGFQQTPMEESGLHKVYRFDESEHVRETDLDPTKQVWVGIDFGVSPMSMTILQVDTIKPANRLYWILQGARPEHFVRVIDEISADNSTTEETTGELVEKLRKYARQGERLKLVVCGDAAGNQRRSSAGNSTPKTDWDIFKTVMSKHAHLFSVDYQIRSSNPSIRDRTNCYNSFLKAADGTVRLRVDPRCKALIRDLKNVIWATDSFGNVRDVQSKKDPLLTHAADSCGYALWIVKDGGNGYGDQPGQLW